jgi:hypothetical protein
MKRLGRRTTSFVQGTNMIRRVIFSGFVTFLFLLFSLMPQVPAAAQNGVTEIVDTSWVKSTNVKVDDFTAQTTPPDDPFWTYTTDVWTGPPDNGFGVAIPGWQPGFWAFLPHAPGGCTIPVPATHQWFRTILNIQSLAGIEKIELIGLFRGNIGINDNLYVWVNTPNHTLDEIVAYGGTSVAVGGYPEQLTDRLPPPPVFDGIVETDGWNIQPLELPLSHFHAGDNEIDVLLEEFCDWGGVSRLSFLITGIFPIVSIDIKPGGFPNSINPKNKGVIPVAILTTDTFDATTVDPTTVRFGRSGTEAAVVQSALEDVNSDGRPDLILHFRTQETGIKCGDTSASLTGHTTSGQAIQGSDAIVTVGCK